MYLLDAMPYSSVLLVLLPIVITQSKFVVDARCIFKHNATCECSSVGIERITENLLSDCEGATALVVNDAKLSEENWPNGLDLRYTDIVNLTLSGNAFKTIPTEYLPSELEVLVLSGNKIKDISKNQLSRLKKIKNLDLSYNIISTVDDDAFYGLCALEELSLKGNDLHNFANVSTAFRKTPSLKIVDLAENSFENAFVPEFLKNLQVFNLRNNRISAVSVGSCTYRLPNLQVIDLQDNNLTWFPRSILDSLNETVILLSKNPLRCDCDVGLPLMNYKCKNNTVNWSADCMDIGSQTRTTTDSKSLIISSGSELYFPIKSNNYCTKYLNSIQLTDVVTEICWDVPEDICEETKYLIRITEDGSLNLTMASHLDISGLYTYKEYHACRDTYLYTVTGQVRLQRNTSDTQRCLTRKDYCEAGSSGLTGWQVALIVVGGSMCVLLIVAMVLLSRIRGLTPSGGSDNVDSRLRPNTKEPPPHTTINADANGSQKGVSHVVSKGYLVDVTHGSSVILIQSSDNNPHNATEALEQGYKSLSTDANGYLITTPSLGKDHLVHSSLIGYFTYISNESANEVLIDIDGYLRVKAPAISTTEDGYTCLILRKDQGALGQLIDENQYIKLIKRHANDDHTYSKLQTTWKLLSFWENKEQEYDNTVQVT